MTTLASNSKPSISPPYPGTAPFQDRPEDRLVFFGRDREISDLTILVLSEAQVLLFARSGVGKTSLINAGLLENLRQRKFFTISARVTDEPEQGPAAAILDTLERQAAKYDIKIEGTSDRTSLWTYFYRVKFVKSASTGSERTILKPILVLDQFEELFTLLAKEKREKFIAELADLVGGYAPRQIREDALKKLDEISETDPAQERLQDLAYGRSVVDVKLLIAIREDFLAELDAIKARIPDIFRHTFRLEPLRPAMARDAITKPSQQRELLGDHTIEFDPAVVNAMISFLSSQQSVGTVLQTDDIEPVQLQILCRSLFERVLASGRNRVTSADLGGEKGMRRIMGKYYFNVLRKLPPLRPGWNARRWYLSTSNLWLYNMPRYAAQQLCENGLILPNGVRNSLEEGFIASQYGVPAVDLSQLVQQHLLRSESRTRGKFYELSHDSLTNVLLSARAGRRLGFVLGVAGVLFWGGVALQPTVIGPALIAAYSKIINYKTDPLRAKVADSQLSEQERRQEFENLEKLSSTTIDLHDLNIENLNLDGYAFQKPVNFQQSRLINSSFKDIRQVDNADLSPRKTAFDFGSDFRKTVIANSHFDGSYLPFSRFEGARIDHASFQGTILTGTQFSNATIAQADFSGASLIGSNFYKATLDDVTFARASLNNSNFSDANLTKTRFTNAALESARFDNVVMDPDTSFSGAEWWLASGWSDDQFRQLKDRFPYSDYVKTPAFAKALQDRQTRKDNAKRDLDKAKASNEIAWYRAVHGVDLREANADADEALKIAPDDNTRDTKAYILMLLSQFDNKSDKMALLNEAKQLYAKIVPANTRSSSPDFFSRGWSYRYGLVLDYLGESAEADRYYQLSASAGYQPTHERLFMPRPKRDASH